MLLNFWYAGCAPCHEQFPHLKEIYSKYKNSGLEIIGISIDHNRSLWKNDIVKSGIGQWPNILALDDSIKELGKEVPDRFSVDGYPMLLLIDKSGVIIYRNVGYGGIEEITKLDALIHSSLGR